MKRILAAVSLLLSATLFFVFVRHFFFLCDDAFISFRYAEHLADGLGLVWNPGERVEGYTNFLWVVLMSFAIQAGRSPEFWSNAIGIACGGALLALVAQRAFDGERESAASGSDDADSGADFSSRRSLSPVFIALLFLAPTIAASRSFAAWSTGGLATMPFALLIYLATERYLIERRADRVTLTQLTSSLLLAAAALTRPDGILFAGLLALVFLADVMRGRRSLRAFLLWCAPLVVIVGAHFLWRFSYYGYLLPNTFYAKVNGFYAAQSVQYFRLFHADYLVGWFLPFLLIPALAMRSARVSVYTLFVLSYGAYLFYIGGDHFEFRFLVFLFPYFYWLLLRGIAIASQTLPARMAPLGAGCIALLLFSTTLYGTIRGETSRDNTGVADLGVAKRYAERRVREGILLRESIDKGALPKDAVICVIGAGAVPYYTKWETIDFHGINDESVAHLKLSARGMIAHEKRAPVEYLVHRGVEIFDAVNLLVYPDPGVTARPLPAGSVGKWRSVRLSEDAYLNFLSFLNDKEFDDRFGRDYSRSAPR